MRSYPLEVVRGILDQDLVGVRERPGSGLSILINFNRCLLPSKRVTNLPRFQYVSSIKKVLFDWVVESDRASTSMTKSTTQDNSPLVQAQQPEP
jgi:hypothetical protein